MPTPLSTHLSQVAGAIETVPSSGTLIVDTGLRNLQSLVCTLAQNAVSTAATTSWEEVTQAAGTTKKVTLKTWDEDGVTAGTTAAKVSWIAVGE